MAPLAIFELADTHDDAFTKAWTLVFQPAGVRFMEFISCAYVGLADRLTLAQLTTLKAANCDICAHTWEHEFLGNLTPAQCWCQLWRARRWLVDNALGGEIIGPPAGVTEQWVTDMAIRVGYTAVVSAGGGFALSVLPAGHTYRWQSIADLVVPWANIEAAIATLAADSTGVTWFAAHVVTDGAPQGSWTTTTRLQAIIDALGVAGVATGTLGDLM